MKKEIEIKSDRWERMIREAVYGLLCDSFATNQYRSDCNWKKERFFGETYEYSDGYMIPEGIWVDWIGGGIMPLYDCLNSKHVGYLNGSRFIHSKKHITRFEKNDISQVYIETHDYCMSSQEFEKFVHRNIKKYKDREKFWCMISVNSINPYADSICAGMALGYD